MKVRGNVWGESPLFFNSLNIFISVFKWYNVLTLINRKIFVCIQNVWHHCTVFPLFYTYMYNKYLCSSSSYIYIIHILKKFVPNNTPDSLSINIIFNNTFCFCFSHHFFWELQNCTPSLQRWRGKWRRVRWRQWAQYWMGCVFYFYICWKTKFLQVSSKCIDSVIELACSPQGRVFMSWSGQTMTYFSVI